MRLRELKRAIALVETKELPVRLSRLLREVKVWLPGTTISLSGEFVVAERDGKPCLLIEGTIDPGSTLGQS
jgi:hypothetical protein